MAAAEVVMVPKDIVNGGVIEGLLRKKPAVTRPLQPEKPSEEVIETAAESQASENSAYGEFNPNTFPDVRGISQLNEYQLERTPAITQQSQAELDADTLLAFSENPVHVLNDRIEEVNEKGAYSDAEIEQIKVLWQEKINEAFSQGDTRSEVEAARQDLQLLEEVLHEIHEQRAEPEVIEAASVLLPPIPYQGVISDHRIRGHIVGADFERKDLQDRIQGVWQNLGFRGRIFAEIELAQEDAPESMEEQLTRLEAIAQQYRAHPLSRPLSWNPHERAGEAAERVRDVAYMFVKNDLASASEFFVRKHVNHDNGSQVLEAANMVYEMPDAQETYDFLRSRIRGNRVRQALSVGIGGALAIDALLNGAFVYLKSRFSHNNGHDLAAIAKGTPLVHGGSLLDPLSPEQQQWLMDTNVGKVALALIGFAGLLGLNTYVKNRRAKQVYQLMLKDLDYSTIEKHPLLAKITGTGRDLQERARVAYESGKEWL